MLVIVNRCGGVRDNIPCLTYVEKFTLHNFLSLLKGWTEVFGELGNTLWLATTLHYLETLLTN